MLNVECWKLNVEYRMLNVIGVKCWMLIVKCYMLNVACWMLNVNVMLIVKSYMSNVKFSNIKCQMLNFKCSIFNVQCLMFHVPIHVWRSMFDVTSIDWRMSEQHLNRVNFDASNFGRHLAVIFRLQSHQSVSISPLSALHSLDLRISLPSFSQDYLVLQRWLFYKSRSMTTRALHIMSPCAQRRRSTQSITSSWKLSMEIWRWKLAQPRQPIESTSLNSRFQNWI